MDRHPGRLDLDLLADRRRRSLPFRACRTCQAAPATSPATSAA